MSEPCPFLIHFLCFFSLISFLLGIYCFHMLQLCIYTITFLLFFTNTDCLKCIFCHLDYTFLIGAIPVYNPKFSLYFHMHFTCVTEFSATLYSSRKHVIRFFNRMFGLQPFVFSGLFLLVYDGFGCHFDSSSVCS